MTDIVLWYDDVDQGNCQCNDAVYTSQTIIEKLKINDSRFITEKLYKPIYNLHPFIVVGAPRMLQLLRDKGYRTFPELFDESYDVEECPIRRIYLVIDEIEKFTKLSDANKRARLASVEDTLKYNQQVYLMQARNKRQDFLSIFERMYES
jgi:hypothetical protein